MGATYQKRGKKSWRVTVHSHGERQYATVRSEQDAKALVQHIHKQELAGINVVEAIRKARAVVAPIEPTYPRLKDALPEWIDGQVSAGDLRASTGKMYRSRLATWVYPHALPDGRALGDVAVNLLTREQLGGVIRKVKEAGRSMAIVDGIRNPLRGYFQMLIETKVLTGPNPAADLRFFVGKGVYRKAHGGAAYFTQEEGPRLIEAVKALYPRWHAFILCGLLGGLRWGESAALYNTDIDWQRGRLHVQRTVSGGSRMEAPKNGRSRWVKASSGLLDALRVHIGAVDLEGSVKEWTPEARALIFPNTVGRVLHRGEFITHVWRPLLAKAGLPYRKYHSTRHTYATWMLNDGADIRFVQQQLGHAGIAQTADVYGHVQPERHEAAVEGLDKYVGS